MGKYFGTDGVRGEANVELTPELAFKLGRFGGYVLSQHETEAPKVFVGRDTRISGEMLESALVAGLLSVGIHVYKLGVLATPAFVKSAVTLNLRVLSCISLAKATLLEPVKKTVTSDVKPLIKY